MVKKFWIMLLLILHFEISLESGSCDYTLVSSTQECLDLLNDEEAEYNYKCCYVTSKEKGGISLSECRLIPQEVYKNIDDYIDDLRDQNYEDPKVDCKSNYLQITLLSLLLFAC